MKFTARHAPDSLELLNLRQSIISEACRHCGCRSAMTAHGFLKGISVSGVGTDTRGLRFFVPTAIRIRAADALSPCIGRP
jgi:hypothetical protein